MQISDYSHVSFAAATVLRIQDIHTHPYFLTVLAASIIGWVMGLTKGFEGTRGWLDKYWQNVPVWVAFGLDFFLFAIVGAYFGTGLFDPSTFQAACAAGFMWPIALQALTSRKKSSPQAKARKEAKLSKQVVPSDATWSITETSKSRQDKDHLAGERERVQVSERKEKLRPSFVVLTVLVVLFCVIITGLLTLSPKSFLSPLHVGAGILPSPILQWIGIGGTLALITLSSMEYFDAPYHRLLGFILIDIVVIGIIGLLAPFSPPVQVVLSCYGLVLPLSIVTLLLWYYFNQSVLVLAVFLVVDLTIILYWLHVSLVSGFVS